MTHADLKEAAEKATPGPWRRGNLGYGIFQDKHAGDEQAMLCRCPVDKEIMPAQWSRDAAFIALANPARILSLIEENERLREALESIAEPPIGYADLNPNDLVIILAENARAALREKP